MMNIIIPDIDSINKYGPLLWVIKSLQKLNDSRFATARMPHKPNFLPRLNFQAKPF